MASSSLTCSHWHFVFFWWAVIRVLDASRTEHRAEVPRLQTLYESFQCSCNLQDNPNMQDWSSVQLTWDDP